MKDVASDLTNAFGVEDAITTVDYDRSEQDIESSTCLSKVYGMRRANLPASGTSNGALARSNKYFVSLICKL